MAAEHRYSRTHGGTTSAGATPVDGRHARVRAREPRVTPRPRAGGVARSARKITAAPQASIQSMAASARVVAY